MNIHSKMIVDSSNQRHNTETQVKYNYNIKEHEIINTNSSCSSPSKKSSLIKKDNSNIKVINVVNSSPQGYYNEKKNNKRIIHQIQQHNSHNNNENYNINNNNINNKYLKKSITKDTTLYESNSNTNTFKTKLTYDLNEESIDTPEDLHFLYVHIIHKGKVLETNF